MYDVASMKIYVFGNQDYRLDNLAVKISRRLQKEIDGVEFIFVSQNEDVPFAGQNKIVIMDIVEGLKGPKLILDSELEKLILAPRTSVHDWDLGFQIKYLKKLGKLGKVTVIGLPMKGNLPEVYDSCQSILRKLVAQDIQGS